MPRELNRSFCFGTSTQQQRKLKKQQHSSKISLATHHLLCCQLLQLPSIEVKDKLSHVRHVTHNQWLSSRLLIRLTASFLYCTTYYFIVILLHLISNYRRWQLTMHCHWRPHMWLLILNLELTPSASALPNCCGPKGSAPYWSNPPFLIFDIRALWRSVLSAIAPKCQKLKMVG